MTDAAEDEKQEILLKDELKWFGENSPVRVVYEAENNENMMLKDLLKFFSKLTETHILTLKNFFSDLNQTWGNFQTIFSDELDFLDKYLDIPNTEYIRYSNLALFNTLRYVAKRGTYEPFYDAFWDCYCSRACAQGNLSLLKKAVERGCPVYFSSFEYACDSDAVECLEYLIRNRPISFSNISEVHREGVMYVCLTKGS